MYNLSFRRRKGFTLIELLVVVSVLILLASIVLVNLRGVRERGRDSRIVSALGQLKTVAEAIHIRDGNYTNICASTSSLRIIDTINGLDDLQTEIIGNLPTGTANPIACHAVGHNYCVSSVLNNPAQFWCIDSGGRSGRATAACASATDGCTFFVAAPPPPPPFVCGTDRIVDARDGNRSYGTRMIAGLCWMTENLQFLPSVSPSSIGSTTDPIYYVYGYQGTDVAAARAHPNFLTYGVLYNWPAAMTACPAGTRLPTDAEQHALDLAFATGSCDPARIDWGCPPAGTALKASSAWDGTNSSGFSALPAGFRSAAGSFLNLTASATFWSSSESGSDAWLRYLLSGNSTVARWPIYKGHGFSVRCVR